MTGKKLFQQMKAFFIFILVGLFVLSGCNMPGSGSKIPATPTVGIQIPLVTVAATDTAMEVIDDPTEEAVEPTATPEVAEEETEEAEEVVLPTATAQVGEVVGEATPTFIPTNNSTNPDATVYFNLKTNCYVAADTDSAISGVVSAGSALGALDRIGNFYQVNHPTKAGVLCWVTGSGISPNGAAFHLGD